MFISRVISKGKKGQSYVSVLLRESYRIGNKVKSRTLAVLTALPDYLIASLEQALALGHPPLQSSGHTQAPLEQALAALTTNHDSSLASRTGPSFGDIFLVHEVAKQLHIAEALGSSFEAKLALWQVLARVLSPATSLLAMVRLAGACAATSILKFKVSFTEDDLYTNGAWLQQNQKKIEATLWSKRPATANNNLFFYDVTSSYFEGLHNALADFGYNRDGKKSKKQLVMGMLTDSTGEPISVSLFRGNTNDLKTFPHQVDALKENFGGENVTLVGDRGMIRKPQQRVANAAGFHYISALHKNEIETLLKSDSLQIELFEDIIHETALEDGRRIVVRRNPVRAEEIERTRQSFKANLFKWVQNANAYLDKHPKAKTATQLKHGLTLLKRGGLMKWVQLVETGRHLSLFENPEALQEARKLDGCYAIVSDLGTEVADTATLHDRYKDLALVERDFRTLKHGHLEIRPWFVIREDNTRAHALTAMLALKIRRKLERAWEPHNMTVEEGISLLGKICVMEFYDKQSGDTVLRTLPEPNLMQAKLIASLGLLWPTEAPAAGVPVVTRVKLEKRRKQKLQH